MCQHFAYAILPRLLWAKIGSHPWQPVLKLHHNLEIAPAEVESEGSSELRGDFVQGEQSRKRDGAGNTCGAAKPKHAPEELRDSRVSCEIAHLFLGLPKGWSMTVGGWT